MSGLDLSVVIPVYRSAPLLPTLVDRLLGVLEGTGLTYEVVFVEDGGLDESWGVLSQLQSAHPDRIVAIELMRNFGQHNALMCGFRHSRGALVVTMDDDLQNPPEEIPRLVDAIRSGEYDVVYGTYRTKHHSGWRNLGSALVNAFYRLTFHMPVTVTSFRIIRRELLVTVFTYNLNFTFIDGILAWNTQRIGQVEVDHEPRAAGRSGYDPRKLTTLAFNLFTNFSLLPLRAVSALGFLTALGGFLLATVYLVLYLLSRIVVPGYASTMIVVLVVGGVQMMSLGIIGEYLGRLHLNVNHKPQYAVRCMLDATPSEDSLEPLYRRGSAGDAALGVIRRRPVDSDLGVEEHAP
jgi:undecaprenyl-phosphate 4-deoxy-4-formamido-L-arabinose transferase